MPRRIFGQKREQQYLTSGTSNIHNKVRHWPVRPEFNHEDDHKIDQRFHTEFVDDRTPLGSLCCPRKTFDRAKPAVLRCRKGDLPPSKCGVDLCYQERMSKISKVLDSAKKNPKIKAQMTRKKANTPVKPSASKMNKKIKQPRKEVSTALMFDYDSLEDLILL